MIQQRLRKSGLSQIKRLESIQSRGTMPEGGEENGTMLERNRVMVDGPRISGFSENLWRRATNYDRQLVSVRARLTC